MAGRAKRKTGGREGRIAARNAEVKQYTPAASGQVGGRYKPLTDKELQDILDTAYRILEEIGMAEVPQVVMDVDFVTRAPLWKTLLLAHAKSSRSTGAIRNMISKWVATKFILARAEQLCRRLILIQAFTAHRR